MKVQHNYSEYEQLLTLGSEGRKQGTLGFTYINPHAVPARTNRLREFYTYLHFALAIRQGSDGTRGGAVTIEGK